MHIATCIGCGCDDHHACCGNDGACYWLTVDYAAGIGVCSCCQEQIARWHAGDRSMTMMVAKIIKMGETEPYYIERGAMDIFPYQLEVRVGDRFTVEWVEMSTTEFQALPQFEHIRLTRQWRDACVAASEADNDGQAETAQSHRDKADRLAAEVAERGYAVQDLLDVVD